MQIQSKLALTIIIVLFSMTISSADVPEYINYQGKITDDTGAPVSDGDYTIIFTIWNAEVEGEALWGNDINVTVTAGLFSVALGPISDNIFSTGAVRWLSINIGGEGELEPREQLFSAPYAFHALRADSAYHIAGAADCGWIRDSRGVKLKVPGDFVGIGTAAPSVKLEVEGDIKATDSIIAKDMRIGSLAQDGSLTIFGDETAGPAILMQDRAFYGGGLLRIYEPDGTTFSHSLESDVDATGGGYMFIGCGDNSTSVIIDGNFNNSNDPSVTFMGMNRSTIFNMNEEGDGAVMLPYSSISSSEMWNEAGVASTILSSNIAISSTPSKIIERKMWFPTSGYAVVIATVGYNFWHALGTSDQIRFGVSDTDGVIPSDQGFYRNYPSAWSTFNFSDNATVHGYFIVSAGLNTFYFLGEFIGNTSPSPAAINEAKLTVMFFPTWRGYLELPPKADGNNSEQNEIDQMITSRIEAEKESLRQEFETKLELIRAEMRKQQE